MREKHAINRRFNFIAPFLFFLCVLCASVVNLSAQDFKTVRDGIEYAEMTRTIDNQPVRMNLLRLDLTKVRLDVVHAMDAAIGTETTSSIATRRHALAAINSGFFRLDTSPFAGDPAGIFQIDGKLLSANNGRVALLINNSAVSCTNCRRPVMLTDVSIEHLKTFAEFWNEARKFQINGIDRELKDNEIVLYTPEFGTTTPPSDPKILEIVIDNKRVQSITETNGSTKIPTTGYIVAASGTSRQATSGTAVIGKEGLIIVGSYSEKPESSVAKMAFTSVEDIVGGVPQLIKNSKIDITWEQEKASKSFVETKHPRTAVAKLKDGKFLMITVDGRSESSGGISLYDLASLLLELGATDAMNLDGGGSTTMFLDGKVVNHPSDKEGERKVSDAILVTPRKK
jgi:exopolysaccharide biosynthesis protein